MKKPEFLRALQQEAGYGTRTEAAIASKAFLNVLKRLLENEDNISFDGFGTFSTTEVGKKSGKIPGTDKKYEKAAHVAPKFKFAAGFKKKEAFN